MRKKYDQEFEKEFEKRFQEDLEQIKAKRNEYKLDDEFKAKLKERMDYEYNKAQEKKNSNKFLLPIKMTAAAACCCFVLTSYAAFADTIEDMVKNLFSNTDKVIEQAIEDGNYKKVEMDYVEDNGVSIKVDYIVAEEGTLCVAFNVLTEKEFDKISLKDIEFKDLEDKSIYSSKDTKVGKYDDSLSIKSISKNSARLLYKAQYNKEDYNFGNLSSINIQNLVLKNEENKDTILGNWNLNIDI